METTQAESVTSEWSPLPDLEEVLVEVDEEVIPQDPIFFPLVEERRLGLSHDPSVPTKQAPADAILERVNEEEARV